MNVQQMQKRYDEIEQELQAIHDELAARTPRVSEEEMAAAQATLIAERKELHRQWLMGEITRLETEMEQDWGHPDNAMRSHRLGRLQNELAVAGC